jgi:hypothetical protein
MLFVNFYPVVIALHYLADGLEDVRQIFKQVLPVDNVVMKIPVLHAIVRHFI